MRRILFAWDIGRGVRAPCSRNQRREVPDIAHPAGITYDHTRRAAERRLERKVELGEALDRGQATGPQCRLQPAVVTELNLRGEQLLNRVGRGEGPVVDVLENRGSFSEWTKTTA
jgi:hypothetical protein